MIGPSGCGKTTLLSIIAGLTPPTQGRALVDGVEVKGPGRERGVVFQEDAVFPWLTVMENVEYGLKIRGVPNTERKKVAQHHINLVGLKGFENFYPKELSGGMKKRTDLARVMANNPEILLFDEPFGSLDYVTKMRLQEELLNIWEKDKKTALFVTHDLEEAIYLADRVMVMRSGIICSSIEPEFERPRSQEIKTSSKFQEIRRKLWTSFTSVERI